MKKIYFIILLICLCGCNRLVDYPSRLEIRFVNETDHEVEVFIKKELVFSGKRYTIAAGETVTDNETLASEGGIIWFPEEAEMIFDGIYKAAYRWRVDGEIMDGTICDMNEWEHEYDEHNTYYTYVICEEDYNEVRR